MSDIIVKLRRLKLMRLVVARPRLFSCALIGVVTALLLPTFFAPHDITRLIIGWNVGACLYLLLAFPAILRSLAAKDFKGWMVVEAEQDPAKATPLKYAKMARQYLREVTGL